MKMNFRFRLAIMLGLFLAGVGLASAQWTRIGDGSGNTGAAPSAGPAAATTCLLLTDGSAMCQEDSNPCCSGVDPTQWWRLTPDISGHYETGTWTKLQNTPAGTPNYGPLYYCSAVLADGRVVIIGGEDNLTVNSSTPAVELTLGYIFDPTQNGGAGQWSTPISLGSTGWTQIGDSICGVQADKTFILGDNANRQMASLDLATQTLVLVNSPALENSKADRNGEEGWVQLPDGTILTVDTAIQGGTGSEIFCPANQPACSANQTWTSAGSTIVSLVNNGGMTKIVPEMGPMILRPDGTVIAFGANQNTAVYSTVTKLWTTGPTFPSNQESADGPASLLPSGNVLVDASPFFGAPANFYEFDGTNLNPVTAAPSASSEASFNTRMLLLPTGQVLFTDSTGDVELYTPGGTFQDAWRPAITSAPSVVGPGDTYTVSGTLFNGFSQGAAYGDDAQMDTNYPLVRITNTGSGHVFYARTHDHSSMGVEAVGAVDVRSTSFDAPSGLELGASTLVVVTNGIPSQPFSITVEPATALSVTGATSSEFDDPAAVQAQLTSGGVGVPGKTVNFALGGVGCSGVTDGSGFASCPLTPNQPAGTLTLTATFVADSSFAGSSASATFTVTKEETALVFTGASATTADFDDPATFQVALTSDGGADPVNGRSVTINLGALACVATTNASGIASCTITPNQPAGIVPLTASFTGDGFYQGSSTATSFTVTKEETTLKFAVSSPTVIANGHPTTFSAVLKEDGVTPIFGRSVTITLGAQSCIGTTDGTGTASCTIVVSQPLGPGSIAANFSGDPFYLPSSDSEAVIVFAFLDHGSMIVGNLDAGTGTAVEFWGAQWANVNALSGGAAPNAFKGFADVSPQSCGGGWTASPGNSSGPPATVPSYMGVIASSVVTQSGDFIAGDVPMIIVVKTDPGYGPSPGHAGTGTVVAVFCH